VQEHDLDLPVRTASAGELADELRGAAALAGLKGKLTLGFQRSARAELRTCKGVLAARSPWTGGEPGLYVKGYRSLAPTLFTLVSDGRVFWLRAARPRRLHRAGRTTTAPRRREPGGPARRARPLPRPLRAAARPGEDLEVEEQPAVYVVSARRDGRLERRLWVERRRFTISREVFYDASGTEVSIERERWADVGGRLYPGRLVVRDGPSGAAVLLDFERVTLDPADLKADAFRPHIPSDARTQPVGGPMEGS
jgi:hypothetical protein